MDDTWNAFFSVRAELEKKSGTDMIVGNFKPKHTVTIYVT